MPDLPMPNSAPERIRYCPHCGSHTKSKKVNDKLRRVCPSCGYIHFTDPKVGVGVVLLLDGKLLLVKRAMMPEAGKWSLPAGYLDYGEDPQSTAVREVFEETGLIIEIDGLLDVYHNPSALRQGGASIFILYWAKLVSGEIAAGDDAVDVGFFSPDELPELAFSSTLDVISRWRSGNLP